jgi:hypothetical protein
MLAVLWAARVVPAQATNSNPSDITKLTWRAQELEDKGEILLAWIAYTQIAALDRSNLLAAGKSAQLRTQALSNATLVPRGLGSPGPEEAEPQTIPDQEWEEAKKLLPPPLLQPRQLKQNLRLRGDAKTISTRLFASFEIELIFDGDYENKEGLQIDLADADFEQSAYAWGLVTNSFLIPLSPKLALVVRDTDQKRREQERNVAITMPIPTAISSPEAQELARGVQQMFELQRVAIDTTRGAMIVRDRWSKVRLAQAALEQLLSLRGQVLVDVELYEINERSNMSFGFSLPSASQLIPFVSRANLIRPAASGSFLGFGGGATLFGLGVSSAQLFASMTYSHANSLFQSQIRSLDGLAASLHVGDRFPVVTAQFATGGDSQNALAFPPQVQFEDLGLTLKITPHVHGNNEITLEVESEFKVLTGQTNNDIPVIANRKYTGTVRLKAGEFAVAAGLISRNEARNIGGIAGLARIPIVGPALSTNGRDRTDGQTLLVLRPRIISAPPSERGGMELFTGTETRYYTPVAAKN